MPQNYTIEVHKWNPDLQCYIKEWESPSYTWTWGGEQRAKTMATKIIQDAGYRNSAGMPWCKQPYGWAKMIFGGYIGLLKPVSENEELSEYTKEYGTKMVTD